MIRNQREQYNMCLTIHINSLVQKENKFVWDALKTAEPFLQCLENVMQASYFEL